jgi:ankyrin repeat protein
VTSRWNTALIWPVVCAAGCLLGGSAGAASPRIKPDDKKADAKTKDEKDKDEKEKDNKALKEAAWKGDAATVLALIKKGADVQWRDPADNGKTPLTKCILLGKLDMVKLLVEHGADINYPDGSNRYPVYFCHAQRDKKKAIEMLEFVLSKGGNKDLNREPGMLVSLCDHEMGPPELIPILVKAGADPNLNFKQKQTNALGAAIQAKKPELRLAYVKALIENKADVNFKDRKGMSPLSWAKKVGDKDVIDLLIKSGAKE